MGGQQYLRDVLARLPTHLNSRTEELLPHRWRAGNDINKFAD
ncbi:transposase domain-containing protein [Variovorax brevis]